MHEEILGTIVDELSGLLTGRFLGKVSQLSDASLALDFGVREQGYLFINVEPAAPRLYLIKRKSRQLEKDSQRLSQFPQLVRAKLGGARLVDLTKDDNERVVRLSFAVADNFGGNTNQVLVAQLTGRSANLFLLNSAGEIEHSWRALEGTGQQPGDVYSPPRTETTRNRPNDPPPFQLEGSTTISETADRYYSELGTDREFEVLAAELRGELRKEITKLKRLEKNLKHDLAEHGDPAEHKRQGDLLLANITNAKRSGNKALVTDYYAEGTPTVEVAVDENLTLQEAAAALFARYTKAKRAVSEITERLAQVERSLWTAAVRREKLEAVISERDLAKLSAHDHRKPNPASQRGKRKEPASIPGVRRYRSSDGYEILVGKGARDNDNLTFRIARPNDLWLHASDYPGSHVVVRNSSKTDIPQRTIIEAAQLAGKFSQASKDTKVTVHYTRRKYLTKPKGAAPGLVRMSSFKSMTVEPGENVDRIV
ncbi:MAG TPA: NFACT family protein [Pyrinomonadaceae bacterium]|nr:NFACT family protein [Pyrinomonadaceae bacterium]